MQLRLLGQVISSAPMNRKVRVEVARVPPSDTTRFAYTQSVTHPVVRPEIVYVHGKDRDIPGR